jgi:hypothetical protein
VTALKKLCRNLFRLSDALHRRSQQLREARAVARNERTADRESLP